MPTNRPDRGGAFVVLTVLFEGGLGVAGLVVGWLFGVDALATATWSWVDFIYGLVAAAPMLGLFVLLFHATWEPTRQIRNRIEQTLLPLLRDCSVAQLAIVAALAGIGEEVLFRGSLQTILSGLLASQTLGLVAASVLFGLAHLVTPGYGVVATLIGVYLGGIWLASGNLLTPIVAHAVYDFLAFLYYLRFATIRTAATRDGATSWAEGSADRRFDDRDSTGLQQTTRRRETMKAAFIQATGPADCIQFGELPTPTAKNAEVLVRTHAVSVNPIDTYIRAGLVAMPIPKPYVIGCDLAGVVESVGPEATRFKPGDRVWGSNQGLFGRQGTFSELAAVDESWLYSLPDNVEFDSAAALALVGITAYLGIVRDAQLAPGETVYVTGGSGGVGSAVVQMAKALGAKVVTTAGCPAREDKARSFGADLVVNYKTGNVEQSLKDFAPGGVNVWWETVREPDLEKAVPLMAKRGRIVVMAGREAKPTLPLGPFYTRDCKLMGFAMFNATPQEQRRAGEDMNRWMAEGRLRANIDRILPLSEAAAAHGLQEENTLGKKGTLSGKIVLKP